jgi:hypothetical protein
LAQRQQQRRRPGPQDWSASDTSAVKGAKPAGSSLELLLNNTAADPDVTK